MLEKHPKLHICGMNDGYFKDEAPVIEKINAAKPDVLFVCLGAPKQELFMKNHLDELHIKLMIASAARSTASRARSSALQSG